MIKNIRGVNLGGWLVLERWLTPSLFNGLKAQDEYSFCEELGEDVVKKLEQHRKTYITEADFKWIAAHGLNSVRIPIGYWIFGDEKPFIGAIEYLDFAIKTADKYGLGVVIDLHAAPGSQNGWDHSGRAGEMLWHTNPKNVEQTLEVIERLANHYKDSPNLIGIELLNEPRWDMPIDVLVGFYKRGYEKVRKYCGDDVGVICHDGFRPLDWKGVFPKNKFQNLILDTHLYQCFSEEDKKLNMAGHLKKTYGEWMELLAAISQDLPVIIGEWSLGLDPQSLQGLSKDEEQKALKSFGDAQIEEFNKTEGWFFWTYKTEDMEGWSLRICMEKGLLTL